MMGPLSGLKVVEFAGIGAGPHCAMMLADMGAEIVRIDRLQPAGLGVEVEPKFDFLMRGRRSLAIDLKSPTGREVVFEMIARADALLESFRPGVMERIGLGPDVCLRVNPRLVYARLTGWGQTGPYAGMAGHDINYIALSGALDAMGAPDRCPQPPLNLLGDFGGGALHCAFGVVSALFHAHRSGQGQVVDAAMIDGVTLMMSLVLGWRKAGKWSDRKSDNVVDGGSPYYSTYRTADDRFIAIGAMEEKFYELLLEKLGLSQLQHMRPHTDRALWSEQRRTFEAVFRTKTRDEWSSLLEGTDACFAPVLSMHEAPEHPHIKARGIYRELNGVQQPSPAPRLSLASNVGVSSAPRIGEHSREVLRDWGWDQDAIAKLVGNGVVFQATEVGR
ncbi:CaiB/BaiF CoA-transferase family protein [Bradyrhizobium sp. NP1]|uniref:CaiB/BaiF CoA transferase family protein n=1 Tax=Bradyrhizobium sp. NP1 TaxID=3049772 RepID=UPI0025A5A131|nr:CaiB/BaiF CoA-transferase family protein [Bradyrhizobium sp. NP1]WJR75830.1 CaiB/BaiF CoA-transferase family protein [Bradyrhizobium sp. NP1]